MIEKFQFVPRGSLRESKGVTVSSHLGKLSDKSSRRVLKALLKLHPIHVTAGDANEHGVKSSWLVVAGLRTYRLARSLLGEADLVPVVVLPAADPELGVIDDITSVLMFADSPDVFWEAWDRYRISGEIKTLGRDLDEADVVAEILGRKRKTKKRAKSPESGAPDSKMDPDDILKILDSMAEAGS
jgi:hypothetical protein